VIEDVILHQFTHKAVDGAADGGQTLQDIGAVGIFFEGAQHRFELSNNFFRSINEFKFFARYMCHLLLTTLGGYGTKDKVHEQVADDSSVHKVGPMETATKEGIPRRRGLRAFAAEFSD